MTQFECANAYVDPELLEGSSAELELFHTELDYPDGSLPLDSPFFKQHPHLNHLHLAWESCPEPLTLAPCLDCQRRGRMTQVSLGQDLPNLRQLHIENPDHLSLFSGCPLRCLHLKNVIMTSEKISVLSRCLDQFSRTLTNLGLQVKFPPSLSQTVERESGIVCNLVQSICNSVPRLNVLALSGEIIIAPERCSQWLPLSNTALETLVLNTSKREYHISDSQSIQGTNSPEKNGRDLALAIFEIAPAIRRIAVGRAGLSGCIAEAGGSWCYARRNGKVCLEGRGVLGEDCWMKI
ncbi:hypothetical protein CC2G_013379 [Coprinopsis cinerea AmutBmut pab1-1]|nr:hypothetical protein CC2G_013379 [Coprinopsis cinerea AmutBmut pab1-1]